MQDNLNKDILNELKEIKQSLTQFNERLKGVEERLKGVEESCNKMGSHIDFVENTYEKIKKPFHYIAEKVSDLASLEN